MSKYFIANIFTLQQEAGRLEYKKIALEKSISILKEKTWGMELREVQGEKFIILPKSKTLNPGWTVNKNPAWKME